MADAFHHRDGNILQKLTDEQVANRIDAYNRGRRRSSASWAGCGRRPAT